MHAYTKVYTLKNTILLSAIITLCRLIYLYTNHIDLHPDEAQYWVWSRHLALGYYSKPPVIAWLIALSTSACGPAEPCIRIFSPLLHFATAIIIFHLAKYLWDEKTDIQLIPPPLRGRLGGGLRQSQASRYASYPPPQPSPSRGEGEEYGFFAALGFLLLPGVTFSSTLITTDPPLLTAYAGALLFFVKAIREDKLRHWIWCGIFTGAGLLTKYTMAVFLLSAFLYIAVNTPARLKNFKPWLAALIAFVIFLPNLIWNLQNHLVSFRHTEDNLNPETSFAPIKLLEFLAAQAGIFGPIFFVFLTFILLFRFREIKKDERHQILYYFFLPLLAITLAVCIISRAHGNWAAPIYVPATILVVAWLLDNEKMFWLRAALILNLLFMLLFYNLGQMHLKLDPYARLRGWREFSGQIGEIKSQHPGALIFTDERKIAAELSYYLQGENHEPAAIYKWNPKNKAQDYFDLALHMEDMKNHDFIFITRNDNASIIANHFAANSLEKTLPLPANPKLIYRIYFMKNFEGY